MNDDNGLDRLSSGIGGLDTVLQGGFFRGGLYLIQGTPGTGKTTIANQICFHHVTGGNRAIYVTLLAEYHARMVQFIGRMSFFDESKIPDQLSYFSGFRILRDEGVAGLLTLMRREIIAKKVSVLIVDGIMAARRIAEDDQAFNEFVHELQGIAIATRCTVFLIASADRDAKTLPEHTMVDGILELSDQSIGWSAHRALHVVKIRGSAYLRGKHAYKITDDGVVVYPRIEAVLAEPSAADHGGTERVATGVAQLDAMLGGGLPSGSPTLLLGPSGTGKTTFGLQFLSRCSDACPGLMLGFYEPPARILAKARQVCRPLVNLLDGGAVEMLWQPPTDDSLDAYGERLLTAVRRRGVKRLFLDGLGGLLNAPDATERMRQYLPTLTNELRVQGVTTLYSLEAGNIVGPDTRTSFGDLSVLAENLVLLRYIEHRSRLHRLISILKVRDSDFDPLLHEFFLTSEGPVVNDSAASAEAIMSGLSPRQHVLDAELKSPRVD
ncbi:MAG: circadian clock protein KaiC [Gammaproteobacteria bacterium]|nr:circadian clock protein KaiC [Gammaproteobacteria bacterium]